MSQVGGTSGLNSVNSIFIDLGPSSSVQLMFAALQLKLSEQAKTKAINSMNEIQKSQEEQKLVSQLLNEARQKKADAAANKGDHPTLKNCSSMSNDMIKYMNEHKLAYDTTGNDYYHNKDEWDVAIQSLQGRLDQLGSTTQQTMVFIQDFMGQYNSYLQGANTQIANANQTLQSLARGQ